MVNLVITKNEGAQRLDRFLKKYLKNASLSYIYKLIRKDVKVNGKRVKEDTMLKEGDALSLYMREEELERLREAKKTVSVKKQFGIVYEDENLLAVMKPFGLLTHGDAREKKNTLANQVQGYLRQKGDYDPVSEKTFVPSPVNRLDRNTTGIVLFGKNNESLQALNQMIRQTGWVSKFYLTIAAGEMKEELILRDRMEKDSVKNKTLVLPLDAQKGKLMETVVRPLKTANGFTLAEVELITGRTHQIRVHLSQAGFPIIGDAKYGSPKVNQYVKKNFGLTTQLLHAYKLKFNEAEPPLDYLRGRGLQSELPTRFAGIKKEIFA